VPRVAIQVGPQVVLGTGSTIEMGFRQASTMKVPPVFESAVGLEFAVGLHVRLAIRIVPGTVPGTVPTVVRGASISASFLRATPLKCGATYRYRKTAKEHEDS